MTHREEASSEKIRFINEDLNEFVIKLKKEKGKISGFVEELMLCNN